MLYLMISIPIVVFIIGSLLAALIVVNKKRYASARPIGIFHSSL